MTTETAIAILTVIEVVALIGLTLVASIVGCYALGLPDIR